MARKKIENRRAFSKEEKEAMLRKSGCKCSHCGKKLDINSMTVEHVIPISKGGTNDMINLVALCEDCNKGKTDYVIKPSGYYTYIKKGELKNILTNFDKYCNDMGYFSMDNLFPTDYVKFLVGLPVSGRFNKITTKIVEFKKAVYSDLDELYYFFKNYNEYYGIPTSKGDLKIAISRYFRYGSILFTRNAKGDILLAMCIQIYPTNAFSSDYKKEYSLLTFSCFPCINPDIASCSEGGIQYKRNVLYLSNMIFNFITSMSEKLDVVECNFKNILHWKVPDKFLYAVIKDMSERVYRGLVFDNSVTLSEEEGEVSEYSYIFDTYSKDIIKNIVKNKGKVLDTTEEESFRYMKNGSRYLCDRLRNSGLYKGFCKDMDIKENPFIHDISFDEFKESIGMDGDIYV